MGGGAARDESGKSCKRVPAKRSRALSRTRLTSAAQLLLLLRVRPPALSARGTLASDESRRDSRESRRLRVVTNSSQRTSTQCRGQTKSAELPEAPVPTSSERERERERGIFTEHSSITIFRSERLRAAGLPSVNCAAQVLPGAGLISYQFCSRFAPAFSQVNGAAP